MRTTTRVLALIVALYLLVGLSYALATPPLESSDEYKHFPVVAHIAMTGRLPVLDPDDPGLWRQSAAQPPLYYVLMAGLVSGINLDDLPALHQENPYVFMGDIRHEANNNLIMRTAASAAWPWSGSVLAIILIRLASVLMGAGTIYLAFRLGTLLFTPLVGLLAAALTAFNPMFLFISAAVNNDSLAALVGAAGLYGLVVLWRSPRPWRRDWARYLVLGLLLGAGILTKLSLGGLLGVAAIALLLRAIDRRDWTQFFVAGPLLAAPALLLALPLFLRNLRLYGDLTGLSAFVAVQGSRAAPPTWADWVGEFGTFYRTFWGLFGAINVPAPNLFYALCNGLFLVGVAGGLWALWRRPAAARLANGRWLPLLWLGVLVVLLLRWNIISPAFQGRLLFPGLTGFNALWAAGLLALLPAARWRRRAAGVLGAAALGAAALLPWTHIAPKYPQPAPLAAVPPAAAFGPMAFSAPDGQLALVGVELAPGQVAAPGGDPVALTLYWQALTPVAGDYLAVVNLLGRDYQSVGRVNRYPAQAAVPTGRWQAGQIWADPFQVYVDDPGALSSILRVQVALYDPLAERDLPISGPDGTPIDLLLVGEALLRAPAPAWAPPALLDARFGEAIVLRGYGPAGLTAQPGSDLTLTLFWEAQGAPALDYTVFVQLLDENGALLTGADGPPASGDYPTSAWVKGDRISGTRQLLLPVDLSPGGYTIAVGLYDPATLQRLPLADGSDAVRLPLTVAR